MSEENPTAWELLLRQSKDSRADRFVWKPGDLITVEEADKREDWDDKVERWKKEGKIKERKWPDDFRGFGSNVTPQKQKRDLRDGDVIDR